MDPQVHAKHRQSSTASHPIYVESDRSTRLIVERLFFSKTCAKVLCPSGYTTVELLSPSRAMREIGRVSEVTCRLLTRQLFRVSSL